MYDRDLELIVCFAPRMWKIENKTHRERVTGMILKHLSG